MANNQFRPTAIPLITHDPLFSVWAMDETVTADVTRHWDGVRQSIFGTLIVDGKVYDFLGQCVGLGERRMTQPRKLTQTSYEVRPLSTHYTFTSELLDMELTFTSPLLLNDLDIMGRDLTYIDYKITAKDGQKHAIEVYFGFSAELCVNETDQKVSFGKTAYSSYVTSGTEMMLVRSGDDHRIEWGSFHAIGKDYEKLAMSLTAFHSVVRKKVYTPLKASNPKPLMGPNAETKGPEEYAEGEWTTVSPKFPYVILHKEWEEAPVVIEEHIAAAYDEIKCLQYFGENIDPYWKKNFATFDEMVETAMAEREEVLAKVKVFEDELLAKAKAVSEKYADLLSSAFRQSVAAHKLAWQGGRPLFISKENYSNGSAATVDVTYPSIPLFLMYNPVLVCGMIDPIFDLVDKGLWQWDFAPHDAGTYPLLNGQTYGYLPRHLAKRPDPRDSQMPVEECGNMLIIVATICRKLGSNDYFRKHQQILTQWADYLVGVGYDPENQLCTDDFAGHLAHNCNLSIKAICGLAAFAQLLKEEGNEAGFAKYRAEAEKQAKQWEEHAIDGDHYKLAFDQDGSWSTKYNLVWDRLLDLKLFSQDVYKKEIAFYKTKMNKYGLPMDCRGECAKTDWELWAATLTDDREFFDMIVDRMWQYQCDSLDRVPMSDHTYTTEPFLRGFIARSVQGGLYIKLLKF